MLPGLLFRMRSARLRLHLAKPLHLTLLVVGVLAWAGPVVAHHGWSGYDSSKEMTLTGTIREAGYEHPHGYVRLETAGKVWVVVLAPPSRMENRGLPRATLQPGVAATVVGYPNRTDPDELRAERIIIAGKTTELR
jgi:hypothetical protein